MNARERILTIRLIEKVTANPACAKTVGIVARNTPVKSAGDKP